MFVDMLLRLLGENPVGYPTMSDKFAIILVYLLDYGRFVLPVILFIIPLLVLYWKKKRGAKIKRKTHYWVIGLCLLLAIVGYFIPEIIANLLMGLAVQNLYGGQV